MRIPFGFSIRERTFVRFLLADVPLEVIVRTLYILLVAYEDLGICEAWPVATLLAYTRQ